MSPTPATRFRLSARAFRRLLALAAGALIVGTMWLAMRQADRGLRADLLLQARMIAMSINPQWVAALSGTAADLASPDYQRLKEQLTRIRHANPQCRFLYLMSRRSDGTILFQVDSESAFSKDYSPPGQTYDEALRELHDVFATGREAARGPYNDRWGTWVSAFVPLVGRQTDGAQEVLGMDIDARDWNWNVASHAALPAALGAVAVLLGLFVATLYRSRRDIRKRDDERDALLRKMLNAFVIFDSVFDDRGEFVSFRFVDINDAYERITGVRRDEVRGKTVHEVWPGTEPSWIKAYGEVAVTGVPHEFDMYHGPTAKLYHCHAYRPGASRDRFCVIFEDITERKQVEAALRENEESHRALVAGLPDIVMRFDRAGRHLFVSANVSDVIDLPAAQFIGKTHRELGFPEAQCRFREEAIQGVFGSGTPFETEFTFEGKHGAVIHNWRIVPERDAQGTVRSVLSFSRDITAHRRAEQDYQTLFREMVEGFALHEIICDAQGQPVDYRFLAVNPAFERMTGLKAEKIVGRTVLEVMPGTERQWIATYGKVALTGEPAFFSNYSAEMKKHFDVTAFRSAPKQFACIFIDITARTRAEDEIRNLLAQSDKAQLALLNILEDATRAEVELKRLATAIEQAAEVIVMTDVHGLIQYVNPAFETVTGYTREEAIGQNPSILKSGEHDATFYGELWETITSGRTWQGRFVNRRKDGTLYTEEATISPVRATAGRIVNFVAVKRDITEQLRLADQLQQTQKLESVGRLAGGVAHDFNNILQVILGTAELAKEQAGLDQPLLSDLEEIRKEARRAADLTRQLLAFARKQTIAPKVLDLNETIGSMLKMLRRLIGEDITLSWQPGAALWSVKMDPGQVDQILANLCVNSRDAIAGVGKVTIETANVMFDATAGAQPPGSVPGDCVLLAVSDDGCGMGKDVIEHIFEPFFTTKDLGKGTGLGLATVYGIVKQNAGWIDVSSEPGRTTFKVYLPRLVGEAVAPADADMPAVMPGGHETILLVEDEDPVRFTTSRILTQLGYTVLTAEAPEAGLRLAAAHPGKIHLLITDVVMPGMNGRDLANKLISLYPHLRRLFMSGYTANMIAHRGVLDEGVHFIQKPFPRKVFAAKVREVLDDLRDTRIVLKSEDGNGAS